MHALVPTVQRIYLDGARRWADSVSELPAWVPAVLDMWHQTLKAFERNDLDWLSARLDPWIKYALFTAALEERGHRRELLQRDGSLLNELALLDQQYHELCNLRSPFRMLEETGVLRHRVVAPAIPGDEEEPFVPSVSTRARARARFLRGHHTSKELVLDWHFAYDPRRNRLRLLDDPFAQHYGPWQNRERLGTS